MRALGAGHFWSLVSAINQSINQLVEGLGQAGVTKRMRTDKIKTRPQSKCKMKCINHEGKLN